MIKSLNPHTIQASELIALDEAAVYLIADVEALESENAELRRKLSAPQLHNFSEAVVLEAAHQRERWGSKHDAGKAPADWFWLIGYLAGKALNAHIAGNVEKAVHHTISSAAACANWHAAISGDNVAMRPGIMPNPELILDSREGGQ